MSELFIPEDIEKKNLDEILEPKKQLNLVEPSNLVFACRNEIYMLPKLSENEEQFGKPILLTEREETIVDLCVNDRKLYDLNCRGHIHETFLDKFIEAYINPIGLCSNRERLYLAFSRNMIIDVLFGDYANQLKKIISMTSYKGDIVISKENGEIYNVSGKYLMDKNGYCNTAMCALEDDLMYSFYDVKSKKHKLGGRGKDRTITYEPDTPKGLCNHEGKIYFGCENIIYEAYPKGGSIDYQDIQGNGYNSMPGKITALTSVPSQILEEK